MDKGKLLSSILATLILSTILTACGGGSSGGSGGGGSSTIFSPTPDPVDDPVEPSSTTSITGSVSGTTVMAVNSDGKIVTTDDTDGRSADIDNDGDGVPEAFSFTLNDIPVGEAISIYLVTGGSVYPMYFDSNGDGTPDTNVFSVGEDVPVELGFVDTDVATYLGKAIPELSPLLIAVVTAGDEIPEIPLGVNNPPTGGLTITELNQKGLSAMSDGWVLGARTYFEAATIAAGSEISNDADTAWFFFALTRVLALGFDTLSDGFPADTNRLGDLLDRFGFANDETRANRDLIDVPAPMAHDSPTGNELRDFFYNVASPELEGAIQNLTMVSKSFEVTWQPDNAESVESDYGDVLFFRGMFGTVLSGIATQRAYDLFADIDVIVNAKKDDNPLNDVTIESFLSGNSRFLGLADTLKLEEAKFWLVKRDTSDLSAIDDLDAALVEMEAESDLQDDDFITLDEVAADGIDTARDYLADIKGSIEGKSTIIDRNDLDPDNDINIDLQQFYDAGIDFRSPNRLPVFIGNKIEGTNPCFPDPGFNNVLIAPDVNADDDLNNICDIAE
jgi:hypothetical protein